MIVDALAGGLSGAGCCCDPEAPTASGTDGVFMVAVQIQAFCPLPEFGRTVTRLARHVKSSPPADGFAEVLAPGELEARARRRRLDTGIEVEPAVLQMIRQVVHELGVFCEPVWE
jgi:LDH2 family malate/lactate/ureidoglycolate dehydrogenase